MYYYDPTYLLVIAGVLLSLLAQSLVSRAANEYAQVPARCGLTGGDLARQMLDRGGLQDVKIEVIDGNLTDHYDPSAQTLRLSRGVALSGSITALGVAAHETGHALQHRDAYGPLMLRSASVSTVNIGSRLSWPLVIVGLIASWEPLITVGITLYCFVVLFALVTLPVEFDASRRALAWLQHTQSADNETMAVARDALKAAAYTYVVAAISSLGTLIYYIMIFTSRRS